MNIQLFQFQLLVVVASYGWSYNTPIAHAHKNRAGYGYEVVGGTVVVPWWIYLGSRSRRGHFRHMPLPPFFFFWCGRPLIIVVHDSFRVLVGAVSLKRVWLGMSLCAKNPGSTTGSLFGIVLNQQNIGLGIFPI